MPVPSDWSQQLREFVSKWPNIGDADLGVVRDSAETEKYQGDTPFPRFVLTEQAESWDEFLQWLNELKVSWCFRGQREAEWLLHTSLDRARKVEWSSDHSSGYCHRSREIEERELLFRFQQQAHRYIAQPPPDQDLGSWFALMQHHGVPTRLLDWTRSPYVAMYFALEEEPREKCSAVWAIDLDWLEKKGHELLGSKVLASGDPKARAEYLNGLLRNERKNPVVLQVSPLRIDDRMAAQLGFFLCGFWDEAFFTGALMSMMLHPETPDQPVLRRFVVEKGLRIKFLKKLREMNIHRASLFPGLDGFGQSLRIDLEIKVKDSEP